MKSRKAIKRLRQLGRPRKEGKPRTESGRIKHGHSDSHDKDPAQTAREARQRVFGVSEVVAMDNYIGSALGRLKMAEIEYGISPEQYAAGLEWEKLFRQYVRIREGLPPDAPSPAAMMLDIAPHRDMLSPEAEQPSGMTGEYVSDEDRAIKITRRWTEAYQALARVQVEYGRPSPYECLFNVCARDIMPTGDQQLGNLRIALNILVQLWRKA
jgi:hypothetical protein